MAFLIRVGLVAVVCFADVGLAAAPTLFFSDLTSGPKTGNTDTSHGQNANADGVFVTVWGTGLGERQGTSRVLVNGVEARVYTWGNATAPANLSSRHRLQMISFQLRQETPDAGAGITVVVDTVTSNALPFTVRPGTIRFVAVGGSDTNAGTWAAPMASMQAATDAMAPGDVTYVRDGVSKRTGCDTYDACVNVFHDGTPERPMALVAYPGATVTLGSDAAGRAIGSWNIETGTGSTNWVISKLSVLAAGGEAISANSGWRVIGNFITMPNGDGQAGAIYVGGDHVVVFGNELTGLASTNPTASKLFHTIYVSGARAGSGPRLPTESDREIAWNSLHDNHNNRGINIYSEQASAALIQNHRVHDNIIINQRGVGILLGGLITAQNWVYNNVIDQAGLGPDWPAEGVSGHTCLQIDVGADTSPPTPTTLYVFHNTLSRCGYGPTETPDPNNLGASGAISFGDIFARATVRFENNLVFSEGTPYLSPWTANVPATTAGTNLWFGRGAAPAFDSAAVTQDPRFVNLSAHDLRLTQASPAVDVGVATPPLGAHDLDGVPRPQGPKPDLGAFEFVVACTSAAQCTSPPSCALAQGASCVAGSCVYPEDPSCRPSDAGAMVTDAGATAVDAGLDAGASVDAGARPVALPVTGGCGCEGGTAGTSVLAMVVAAAARRRAMRR